MYSRLSRRHMPNKNRERLRFGSPSAWTSDKLTRRVIHNRTATAITTNGTM
jgi:hypothetical protein